MIPKLESLITREQKNIKPYDSEQHNMGITRRGFLKGAIGSALVGTGFLAGHVNAASSEILDYQVASNHPLHNAHPLYALLYDNAIEHTKNVSSDRKEGERLQTAILTLAQQNFEASAYILIPSYNNFDRNVTINIDKMDNPGGNNPTYWATLRLACQGIGDASIYEGIIKVNSRGPPLPKNQTIFAFANSLIGTNPTDVIRRVNDSHLFNK